MAAIQITSESRLTEDPRNGAIRSWLDTSQPVQADKVFVPRALARSVLEDNANLFRWNAAAVSDLRDAATVEGPGTRSVRFTQEFKGVPVDASEVVVNMYNDSRVYSVYNNYHYDIPDSLDPKQIKVGAGEAVEIVGQAVERFEGRFSEQRLSEPQLIVYQYRPVLNVPKRRDDNPSRESFRATLMAPAAAARREIEEGTYFLVWDVRLSAREAVSHYWRILIDAMTGEIVQVIDLLQSATGTGQVFDPNPIVTSGDTGLSSASPLATLNGQRKPVTLNRLDAAINGKLRLHGSYVQMEDIESPVVAEPESATGDFSFSYADTHFLNTMAYFHIDRFQDYVQTVLGLNNVANFSIHVDPQAFNGADNSFYHPDTKKITWGGTLPPPAGNPVPDAADAMVVLHEYGHAIQDNVNPGFDNPDGGTGEGFGDFLAAVYYDDKHAVPANTRGIMMSWDANPTDHSWSGRRYDMNWLFDGPEYTGSSDPHITGQLWCATMFEIYRKLGGDSQYSWVKSAARDLVIRLHLMANFNVPAANSTAAQMGQQVKAADLNLGGWRYANGLHKKVIDATFVRRHLSSFTALASDVYIDDGRNGGYGSPSGNDLFTEKLFLDNYWSTQDLWVRTTPYANDAAQQAGGPGDHVEPPVNSAAYLYVRVKNKGTTGSGSVTVKAFHSDPTIGLVWPTDWTPTDTPSLTVADIPNGGSHIFGPFPWTPSHVGHECVFAIAECAKDHAVTQDLLMTDVVAHSDLVPFDNNIAQRNLYPTAAKEKMSKGFWVSNPNFETSIVKLHFESTLPEGWTFHTNLANTEAIRLDPRGRRWVEVTIDPAGGREVRDFTNPPRLDISGSIDGKLIGGVSFYAAPESAFPGRSSGGGVATTASAACRGIRWLTAALSALVLILLALVPGSAVPIAVVGIILILACFAYYYRRCKPSVCDLLCTLILGISLAALVLGIAVLAVVGGAGPVFLLALLGVINGVLVIIGELRGCCGHCQKVE